MTGEVQSGKITAAEGRYFLETEGQRLELPTAALGEAAAELVGKEVEVLLSEPVRNIVALVPRRPRVPIICYVPVPDVFTRIAAAQERARVTSAASQLDLSKLHPPICYFPADWLVKGVDEQVRINLAKKLLDEKLIGTAVYEKLR